MTPHEIEQLIDDLDPDRVSVAMYALGWRWGLEGGVPGPNAIRDEARRLIRDLLKSPDIESVYCGGLWVARRREDGEAYVSLGFGWSVNSDPLSGEG